MHAAHLHGPRTLALIAAFKLVKSLALVVLAILLLRLRHPEAIEALAHWLGTLQIATGHESVSHAIHWIVGIDAHTISLFAAVALVYATLYAIEGYGLWENRDWAKYLTVISTCLFIPVELWEMFRHFSPMKVIALGVNVLIVAYLVWLLRQELAGLRQGRAIPGARSTTIDA
jgi:uncharacterized membrane protein (DUF2068 family)